MKTFSKLATIICAMAFLSAIETPAQVNIQPYVNKVNPDAPARKTRTGMIIVGKPDTVRVFSAYSGGASSGVRYAETANKLQAVLGDGVQVYCMPIPSAAEFYTPEAATAWTHSQLPTISKIFDTLDKRVKAVDVYTTLGQHASEPIYSRTDHHWAPLGAYYAARELARVAKVPFRDLTHYDKHVVSNYVGSMSSYAKDPAVKSSPEDFVYYTPRGANYTAKRNVYTVKGKRVVSETGLQPSDYFIPFKGAGAYCTFMGGDYNNTQVTTSVNNGRRLLVIKDSFGNAIPPFLFFSFEQVHVLDFRYFNGNLKQYVKDNGITDVLMANVLEIALSGNNSTRYDAMLNKQ